jgi:hypothetical protein
LEIRIPFEHDPLLVLASAQAVQGAQVRERPRAKFSRWETGQTTAGQTALCPCRETCDLTPNDALGIICETRPKAAQTFAPLKLPGKLEGVLRSWMD